MFVLQTPGPVGRDWLPELLQDPVQIDRFDRLGPASFKRIADRVVVVVARGPMRIDSEFLDLLPQLRLVAALGSGTDHIDVDAALKRKIAVTNNVGGAPGPVAEYVIATTILMRRKLMTLRSALIAGEWDKRVDLIGEGCADAVLGIVGLGAIGSLVARTAHTALNMTVLAYDPTAATNEFREASAKRCRDLVELLATADVVSVHIPLTSATRHFIGRQQIDQMKRGAYLINTSRGAVVDSEALAEAVDQGRLAGAVVDVFEGEPPRRSDRLLNVQNVFATPHCAGLSSTGLETLYQQTAATVRAFVGGSSAPDFIRARGWTPVVKLELKSSPENDLAS